MVKTSLIEKIVKGTILCTFLSFVAVAVPDPGGDPDDPPAPIDGGVSLLVAAGAAYGAKKLYDARKTRKG